MSVVSNIIRRDIATLVIALHPYQLPTLRLEAFTDYDDAHKAYANDANDANKATLTTATARWNAAVNKLISDACSTREASELVAALGKTKGALSVTSLTARGEIEKVSKKDGGNSPAWIWACKVNKLAAALRKALDVE